MSVLTNKYTPAEMSPQELQATFTAREHTVDYLLKSLRDQLHSRTLSSHVITGPRGAGKSTVIQMVALRIGQESELKAAWIPLVFPEEQFEMISLRDMLAAILRRLGKENPQAQDWLTKVEEEKNDEQSEQLAITGLKEITRQTGKRLVLFIENMDQLLEQHLDDQMKGTLRRLLMTDPFMMIIGSTVHVFDSLKNYDKAFFNYFDQVPLHRLNAAQITELLKKRAQYDGNDQFLRNLPSQQAKIRTLVHLTGGNPRLALMLYELLSSQKVTTIVQYLRRLVDELTPLLKHEMENLPPQQQKIIHALMEKGGTAQPTDLVDPTRLPLNAITTQLKRLKDSQIVEVLGGGKGRAAHYTVPDKLFSIWYQMRYLNQNRRRIEMFVEVLRIWFEEEERIQALHSLAEKATDGAPQALRECATTGEYFAASLKGTKHELIARDLCIGSWLMADLKEAVAAYADLAEIKIPDISDEAGKEIALAKWCHSHGDLKRAIEILGQILAKPEGISVVTRAKVLLLRANTKGPFGDTEGAMSDASTVLGLQGIPPTAIALAYNTRGIAKIFMRDWQGAIADFSACVNTRGASEDVLIDSLMRQGQLRIEFGDTEKALKDLEAVIALAEPASRLLLEALINRALIKSDLGDFDGAVLDLNEVIGSIDIPVECRARALVNRAVAKNFRGDVPGAMADYTAAIELKDSPAEGVARSRINRGGLKILLADFQGAFDDFSAVLVLNSAPQDQIIKAIVGRGYCYSQTGNHTAAIADWLSVTNGPFENKSILTDAAGLAFALMWNTGKSAQALDFLAEFSSKLNEEAISLQDAFGTTLRLLITLACPESKEAWPAALHQLLKHLRSEISEAIQFLEPVANVLKGKDPSSLDALPPEQREFALKVLEKFTSGDRRPDSDKAKSENQTK